MKLLHGIGVTAALLLAVLAAMPQSASAQQDEALLQRYRSQRHKVSGGVISMHNRSEAHKSRDSLAAEGVVTADSLAIAADSLMPAADSLMLTADSLGLTADSLRLTADSLRLHADSPAASIPAHGTESPADPDTDLTLLLNPAPQPIEPDTTAHRKRSFKEWAMPDSMSLSRMCWTTAVLPGYGQIYNKQYWKLPILYGLVGTSLGMFIRENRRYSPLKAEYDIMTDAGLYRTPEMDALQERMIRVNTRRELYLGAMLASYIYFIGDAAVNYNTNDVSRIKKATTLSTICPGAGQIYNRSYWKVPFVIGGFASMVYCIDWNNRGYQRFQKAYSLLSDYEANPDKYPDGPTDEFRGRYSASFIKNLKDSYRRNRDLCIILTGAVYILQIIDAHVDAHLKDYDISDDLSFNIEPLIQYNYVPTLGDRAMYGFNISVNF